MKTNILPTDTPLEEVPLPPAYKSPTSYAWPSDHEVNEPPSAYASNISYGATPDHEDDPDMYYQTKDSKPQPFQVVDMETQSLRSNHDEVRRSKGVLPAYALVFISKSRYYIRALAIIIMILSVILILTGIGKFSKAKKNPNFDKIPKPAPITDQPCVVFTGIAVMNLVLSALLILTSCFSSKVSYHFIHQAFRRPRRKGVRGFRICLLSHVLLCKVNTNNIPSSERAIPSSVPCGQ